MALEYLDITTDTFKKAGSESEDELVGELLLLLAETELRVRALEEGDSDELV